MINFKKKSFSWKRTNGFSVLEILVAICVLGGLSLGWIKLNVLAIRLGQTTKLTHVAAEMLTEYYERLRRERYFLKTGCNPLGQDRIYRQGSLLFSLNSLIIDRTIVQNGVLQYLKGLDGCALKQGLDSEEAWAQKTQLTAQVKEFNNFLEFEDLRTFKILLVKVSFKDYSSGKQGELERIATFYN